MPRSKSHKQSKHTEYSSSDEDVKTKDRSSNGDVVSGRVSKDSRKNGDRWNADEKGLVINVQEDKELLKSKDSSSSSWKSKSSRRHNGDSVNSTGLDKDDSKRGKKRKYEKGSEYKEHEEHKDKASSKQVEHQSSKRGKQIIEWPIEEELRNPDLEKELEKRMRRRGEASNDKDKYQDDMKQTEDRQISTRQISTRNECSKDERHKNEEYGDVRETRKRDEKHKEVGERERRNCDAKNRGESGRYSKHRDDKYHEDKYSEDGNKENKYKDDKYMEISDKDERSRDRKHRQDDGRDYRHKEEKRARDSKYRDAPDAKRLRDDNVGTDLYHKKTNNRDGSPVCDDRVDRNKDDKERRGNVKDESSDYRSRSSMKEQQAESEKRLSAKADSVSEWGRPGSCYDEVEIAASHSCRRSSPSGSSDPTGDHHRFSKHEETKYRDYAREIRARHNVHSSRDYDPAPVQSDKKVTSKVDGYKGGDHSGEKRLRPESRSPQVDNSSSSTSNERRNWIKSDARKSLDLEEPGPRSGFKDAVKDSKGSRESANNHFSQVDNDNLSVSSPYVRHTRFSGNSKSFLPPPSPSMFKTGSDGSFLGSTEDDKSKSNIRHRRTVDPNMSRGQSQSQSQGNWNNVPNWSSPMATGGYIPFQHVPPAMFHPLLQQYPPQMFGRPPMKLNPGMPFHVPDHGQQLPPLLDGWDANNTVFGNESHLSGRLNWDPRTQLSNRGWDQSVKMLKNQNAGGSMEVQPGQQKDVYGGHRSNDENWSGPTCKSDEGKQNKPDVQPETINLNKSGPAAQKVTESEVVKEDDNSLILQSYLSRLDVSEDLTQPELYDQCTSIVDLDQETLSDNFDCKILFLEEGVDADVTDSASVFSVIKNSVFQKAMFLYKKQKEEFQSMNSDKEKGGSNDEKSAGEVVADGMVMNNSKENDGLLNRPEEPMNIEVDPAVVKQEEEHESSVVAVKECLSLSAAGLLPCKVEDEDASLSTNDDKNGGGGSLVLSDMSIAGMAVMPPESIEFGSVNLNRIHHHSSESTL